MLITACWEDYYYYYYYKQAQSTVKISTQFVLRLKDHSTEQVIIDILTTRRFLLIGILRFVGS